MAKTIYRFFHPSAGEHLYVLHNTFFELPMYVPMDLAAMVSLYIEIGGAIRSLVVSWPNIQRHDCTLDRYSFEDYIDEPLRERLYKIAEASNMVGQARHNRDASAKLAHWLNTYNDNDKQVDEEVLLEEYYALEQEFQPLQLADEAYCRSLHFTYDWLYKNDEAEPIKKAYETTEGILSSEAINTLYNDYQLPLYLVPQDIRLEDIYQQAIAENPDYYIVDWSSRDFSSSLDNQSMEDNDDLPF